MSLLPTLTMLHGLFSICLMLPIPKLDTWEWIFNNVMNRHTPIVKKRVKHKPLLPWMNNDILQLMYHRDQFKARAKSNILAGIMCRQNGQHLP